MSWNILPAVRRRLALKTAVLCCGVPLIVGAAEAPVKKIMFVGDSVSVGVGSSETAKRFTSMTVKLLNEAAGRVAYKEVNISISGSCMTTHPWPYKGSSGYPFRVADVVNAKPDIVVIQHGVNDNAASISVAEYSYCYRNFVREIKAALPETTIVLMTASGMTNRDQSFAEWTDQANAAVQEIAAMENTVLAQTNMALKHNDKLFTDGVHPNDAGYLLMAQELCRAIQEGKIQSRDKFDFTARCAGSYRLCGYIFQVSEEAAANGNYTCFYNVSKNGWSYVSDGPVRVHTTPLIYPQENICTLENGAKVPYSYRGYFKDAIWNLPGTDGKLIKAVLSVKK